MVSSELERARALAKRQAATYKSLRERQKALKEQGFTIIDKKVIGKQEDLIVHARNEYEQHMADLRDDAQVIRERAAKRKVASTPESRQKIEKMLATGWTLQDACDQLVKEGDKAAMTALHEYLPYAARAGHLPVPHQANEKDYSKVIKHAQEMIGLFEPKLWDKQEAAVQAELREVNISMGMIENNHNKLTQHLEYEERTKGVNPQQVKNIYRWQGLPDDPAIEKGLEWLHPELAPKQSMSIKQVREVEA